VVEKEEDEGKLLGSNAKGPLHKDGQELKNNAKGQAQKWSRARE
jgi:hypothetical protein